MLISEFARLGQVSVRMLRHYDAIGLLSPSHVESGNGYRSYSPDQLQTLNRLVALKDLGFTLDQVGCLLHDDLEVGELHGMLRLKRAQLENEARAVETRLAAVETRLRMIEKENAMSPDYVVKTVPSMRLVAKTATLDADRFGEHIGPMFDAVAAELRHISGSLNTPIATYAETEVGMSVVVGFAYSGMAPEGTEVVELPEATAVCGVHLGPMTGIQESWQDLHRWVITNGYSFAGPCRPRGIRRPGRLGHRTPATCRPRIGGLAEDALRARQYMLLIKLGRAHGPPYAAMLLTKTRFEFTRTLPGLRRGKTVTLTLTALGPTGAERQAGTGRYRAT